MHSGGRRGRRRKGGALLGRISRFRAPTIARWGRRRIVRSHITAVTVVLAMVLTETRVKSQGWLVSWASNRA